MKQIILTSILIFVTITFLFSQETVVYSGISYDKNKISVQIQEKTTEDTLELPFFDDFSTTFPEPSQNNWQDNYVTINKTIARKPPSIGVATFDAVDNEKNFYSSSYSTVHKADNLTSKPINLDYSGNNTVYLSFYYQAQGIGDTPEIQDSLVLQFYAPELEQWQTVWSIEGADAPIENPVFEFVMLQITEAKFLKKGFQFRFYNKASLAASNKPSIVANCDHWHIDYIYLNKDRDENDIVFRDVAIQTPITFLIDNYETIPYHHYKQLDLSTVNFNYRINLRNNFDEKRPIDTLIIFFKEINNLVQDDSIRRCGSHTLNPTANTHTTGDSLVPPFPVLNENLLSYNMETILYTNTNDMIGSNDTISQSKILSGNYAYDDGTSEAGWGLTGEGTLHSLVAYKYFTYVDDTIKGVQIFFNNTFKDAQPNYFYLMVWENDPETGLPGQLLYEKDGMKIDKEKLNTFQTYYIDSAFAVTDTFYIGWKKTNTQLMNVGLDLNRTDENHKYFNINGNWQKSGKDGELLMQPFFAPPNIININEIKSEFNVNIFPNPAANQLNYNITTPNFSNDYYIAIYDIYGKIIYNEQANAEGSIDVSSFVKGIYIMRITNSEGEIQNKKFIKL